MEEAKYFLQSQGELALGPFTLAELAGKGLTNSTLLYSTDRGKWIPVDQIPEVADLVRKESESKAHEGIVDLGLDATSQERGAEVDGADVVDLSGDQILEEELFFTEGDESFVGQSESWVWHYRACWRKYADFQGRSSRKQYWCFVLVDVVVQFPLAAVDGWLGTFNFEAGFGLIGGLYILAALIPRMAALVRRLHDVGKSGWVLLIAFIPFGVFLLIYWVLKSGERGVNKWGPRPHD